MDKILFINHGISKSCGVYTQGLRHFNAIKESVDFEFIYAEINSFYDLKNICNIEKPICILYNYMPIVLPWITENIREIQTKHVCIIHNITQSIIDTRQYLYGNLFDDYITLDMSLNIEGTNIFKTNRPIYKIEFSNNVNINNPVNIGTFGFPFVHKGFHKLVEAVNSEFDNAIINLHMTDSYFCGNDTQRILYLCNKAIKKDGIKLNYTNNYLSEIEMVSYLNKNDINALFYDNIEGVGVSAAIDYLISAQKPILISESQQFRNFHDKLPIFNKKDFNFILDNYIFELNNVNDIYNQCVSVSTETDKIIKKIINVK